MLLDEIKEQNKLALKNHDKIARAIYSIVITECQTASIEKKVNGQEFGDNEVLHILQKMIKGLAEEKENYIKVNNLEMSKEVETQINLLNNFLPAMMSEEDIKAEIDKLQDKTIGSIMRHFKQNFNGKVDMSLVQAVYKSLQ